MQDNIQEGNICERNIHFKLYKMEHRVLFKGESFTIVDR
jgi:hypothetical protein